MHLLPTLVTDRSRWTLPMADGSAVALARLLLLGDAPPTRESLVAALAFDPPLVLWTVCVAAETDRFQPHGLDDVARWLAQHGVETLQWEPDQDRRSELTDPSTAEAFAARIVASLQLADLAAQLAAANEAPASEMAFMLGLLHDARDWPSATDCDAEKPGVPARLPGWLAEPSDRVAAASVELARAVLADEASLPDSTGIDVDACRRRAADGGRRWLARVEGFDQCLPALAARLARLATLEGQFEEALESEKLEAMAEFAAGAGHEINNPLTVIAGRAQLFLREEQDPERRRALALMNTQAKRVYEMIADMMLFARPPQPEFETVDLVSLIERLVEAVSPHASQQETAISRTGYDGTLEIEADGTQLTVALRAMCQNSLEAIGRQGRIEISVQQEDGQATIRVSDDGPGMTPEERRHVFDPYYSARQAGRGLGLGLSKAWRIVTNHGGRIDVDSQPGQGATFTITLPITRPVATTKGGFRVRRSGFRISG